MDRCDLIRRSLAALAVGCATLVSPDARAQQPPYFYRGYDYGNQALYNPLYVLLNRGFDVMQIRPGDRDVFDQPYGVDAQNVWNNVTHPFPAIGRRGWGTFAREELLPLTATQHTARWLPNYQLHLIGGGMTFAALREWYAHHGVPLDWVASAVTVMAAAFINEMLENKAMRGDNTDAIADLLIFDLGGIALFSFQSVNRFFAESVKLTDWSLQPTFVLPTMSLHNAGNYFAAKWPLPFYPRLSLFSYMGLGNWLGLSAKLDGEYAVSSAVGMRTSRLINTSRSTVENAIEFRGSWGAFLDRNGSLLASCVVTGGDDQFVQLNVYPNAFFKTDPGIGFWGAADPKGHVVVGVSITRALGLGLGYGTLR